ncbi:MULTISPECIES: methionine ABC transporter ATP-binding protein [Streptomyces violaceusniger group]|uniref:ATP-binding cassette domain-containing protein n=2 Tax=Streptomyces rhizosphaericus TaxID=114699 RepID=A0ABN1S790_9ACTN|nr:MULTISPECIES: ATP-binding cassette domain-containing protein [Streptomyces violaceusniger group]
MIRVEKLHKTFGTGTRARPVLHDVDLNIAQGTVGAVVGPSGAGKSTLARCVNLLERPTSGRVWVAGTDVTDLPERDLRHARRAIGTVFQSANLLRRRTAAQNVAMPLRYLGVTAREEKRRVAELLERVGLTDRADDYPAQLSGGQRQRVGIARALALRPKVLLSDEATSGLDPAATRSVLALLRELRTDLDLAILLITHEMEVVREVADTAALLREGRVIESGPVHQLVADPHSALGNALLPDRPVSLDRQGLGTWRLTYQGRSVPTDWLTRLGADHGLDVHLLSATVEEIAGRAAGRATVAVGHDRADELTAALDGWGIHAEPLPPGHSGPAEEPAASEPAPEAAAETVEGAVV